MLLKIFDIMCAVKIFESSHTCFQCGNFAKSRFLLQGVPLEIVSFQMVRNIDTDWGPGIEPGSAGGAASKSSCHVQIR